MNLRFLSLTVVALTPLFSFAELAHHNINVHFRNGDHLQGSIKSWDQSKLVLISDLLEQPITIAPSSVTKFSILPHKIEHAPPSQHETLISIKPRFFRQNKAKTADLLRGQLTNISDNHITIDTWYAGQLTIDRSMIASMNVFGKGKQAYYGPNSIEEWNNLSDEPIWSFKDGILIGRRNGHIAKNIDMSNTSVLSFDYSWVGNPDLRILLFSDDTEQDRPKNFYDLSLRSNHTKLHKTLNRRPFIVTQMQRAPQLRGSGSAHIDFYADATKGTFALFLDGQQIFVEQDRSPSPDSLGGGLHLISENSPLSKISNLQVNRWNGDIPKSQTERSFESLEGKGEKILLRNGDAVIGNIESIDDETLKLQTPHTPLLLPLERMRSLDLKNLKENAPIMKKNDVLARFQAGGWIILDLHSLTSTSITGYNQSFGTATFNLNAFSSIEFNIYEEALSIGSDH